MLTLDGSKLREESIQELRLLVLERPGVKEKAPLGELIQELRRRKRFTKRALSEASTVSDTYIAQLEAGFDPRTKQPVQPSPKVLRLLADAFSDGDTDEADQIYGDFMEAIGYLPPVPSKDAVKGRDEARVSHQPSIEAAAEMYEEYADILETMGIDPDDSDLIIAIAEFLKRRRAERQREPEGS